MPFGDPVGQAIGKNGDDFATDGADALGGIGEERDGHLREPVGLDEDIVVTENDDFAASLGDGAIAGVVEALPGFEQVARGGMSGGKLGDNGARVVGRVVVEDEDLEVIAGKLLRDEAGEGLAQEVGAIVGRNRDGDFEGGGSGAHGAHGIHGMHKAEFLFSGRGMVVGGASRKRKSFPLVRAGGSLGGWRSSTGPSFVMFGSRKSAGGFCAGRGNGAAI